MDCTGFWYTGYPRLFPSMSHGNSSIFNNKSTFLWDLVPNYEFTNFLLFIKARWLSQVLPPLFRHHKLITLSAHLRLQHHECDIQWCAGHLQPLRLVFQMCTSYQTYLHYFDTDGLASPPSEFIHNFWFGYTGIMVVWNVETFDDILEDILRWFISVTNV